MWLGGDECSKPDQAENRGWLYRNCGGERVSVCGIRKYPGWVLSPEQIYENVWGYDYPADPNNLTSFIRKLRKKIEPEPDRPRYIVTVRGVGYKYTENEEMVGKTATPPE